MFEPITSTDFHTAMDFVDLLHELMRRLVGISLQEGLEEVFGRSGEFQPAPRF